MLRSLRQFLKLQTETSDHKTFALKDAYFDDDACVLRYLIVDTGEWLPGRLVLISPRSITEPEAVETLPLDLSKSQMEKGPGIDADRPVSRQDEEALHAFYHLTPYWTQPGLVTDNPNLRSVREIIGYSVDTADEDEVGTVEDLLISTREWAIRYICVDLGTWLRGRKTLIAPDWGAGIHHSDQRVVLDVSKNHVEQSPGYDPGRPLTRAVEERLYAHYDQHPYWQVVE